MQLSRQEGEISPEDSYLHPVTFPFYCSYCVLSATPSKVNLPKKGVKKDIYKGLATGSSLLYLHFLLFEINPFLLFAFELLTDADDQYYRKRSRTIKATKARSKNA